jgi:uncharacterized protein YbjT (DUF2867 family)
LRVLILGANELIGSAVAARLVADHHEVVAATRSRSSFGLTPVRTAVLNLALATNPRDWLPHLEGIDTVVNCAGVLQDGPRDSTAGVHILGVQALVQACEQAGLRRGHAPL